MNTILLEQYNSAFISDAEKDKNFSHLDYISISNYYTSKSKTKCVALINFNLNLLKCSEVIVHDAKLILPLELSKELSYSKKTKINIFYNTEAPSYKTLTWNTRPNAEFYSSTVLDKKNIKDNYISLDLTSLVCKWMYRKAHNFGIAISLNSPNSILFLAKYKINKSPKLMITYSINSNDNSHSSTLYLQLTNKKARILKPSDFIIMNKIRTLSHKGIDYDINTGIITIQRKGFYNFTFDLNLEGSGPVEKHCNSYIDIALKNLSRNKIITFNSPEIIPQKIIGSCLVEVKKAGEKFVLINNSKKILQLSNLPIQGSLSVFNI